MQLYFFSTLNEMQMNLNLGYMRNFKQLQMRATKIPPTYK